MVYYKGPRNNPSSSDQFNFPPAQVNVQNPRETVRFMIVLCFVCLNWNEFSITVNICNLTLNIFHKKREINVFLHHYKRSLNPVSRPLVSNSEPETAIKYKFLSLKTFLSKKCPLSINSPNTKAVASCFLLFFLFRFFPYVESKTNDALINVLQGNTFIFEVFVL